MTHTEEDLNTGIELLLTAQLFLEISDRYKLKGMSRRYANLLVKELEKAASQPFNDLYKNDEEFAMNALKKKSNCIKIIAGFNEVDAILFEEFTIRYDKNKLLARKKGISFFDKLL